MSKRKAKITVSELNLFYGDNQVLHDIKVEILDREVTALIGPSGCGKSSFLRCLNRMNDNIPDIKISGNVNIDNEDIYKKTVDVVRLRAKVGMVFQKPNPFPKSIYDNVAYGPKIHGLYRDRHDLDRIVQKSLQRAALWDEVKDRLSNPGTGLSGGQQQR